MPYAQYRTSLGMKISPSQPTHLLVENQTIICGWNKIKKIPITLKIYLYVNFICHLTAIVQNCVRTTLKLHKQLKAPFIHLIDHAKQADEIALTHAIGANQNIQIIQSKYRQFPNGFIASNF